jgi:hypothetical protein
MNYRKPRCRWTQNLASLNPELNPEARRILEKLLADETIPERQDLEGLKIPIGKLVKVHRWKELFGQKIKIYRVGFCNWRYSVGDAAGAYYADKRFWRLPSPIKVAGRSAFSEAMRKGKNFRASDKSGTNIGEFEVWPSDQQPPIPP